MEEVRALIAFLISGGKQEIVFETRLQHGGGGSYPAEICMQYLKTEETHILIAIVHDTTDRQRLGPVYAPAGRTADAGHNAMGSGSE